MERAHQQNQRTQRPCQVIRDGRLASALDRARAVIHSAASFTDILRPGIDDATELTGLSDPDEIVDFYLRLGPKIVALTLGDQGALVATKERREWMAPMKVRLVDATGAGDMFDGAFLAESPWGQQTKGKKTRRNKRTPSMIVSRRARNKG